MHFCTDDQAQEQMEYADEMEYQYNSMRDRVSDMLDCVEEEMLNAREELYEGDLMALEMRCSDMEDVARECSTFTRL